MFEKNGIHPGDVESRTKLMQGIGFELSFIAETKQSMLRNDGLFLTRGI